MKLSVKNLKGEVFQVDVEPSDTVPLSSPRSKTSRIRSKTPRVCLQTHSKSSSKARQLPMKTLSRNWPSKKQTSSSSWPRLQYAPTHVEATAKTQGRSKARTTKTGKEGVGPSVSQEGSNPRGSQTARIGGRTTAIEWGRNHWADVDGFPQRTMRGGSQGRLQ